MSFLPLNRDLDVKKLSGEKNMSREKLFPFGFFDILALLQGSFMGEQGARICLSTREDALCSSRQLGAGVGVL